MLLASGKNSNSKSSRETFFIRGFALLSGLLITTSLLMGVFGHDSVIAQSGDNIVTVPLDLPAVQANSTVDKSMGAEIVTETRVATSNTALSLPSMDKQVVQTINTTESETSNNTTTPSITLSTIWSEEIVRKGDTLSAIFDRNNIHSALDKVLQLQEVKKNLIHIKPGQVIKLDIDGKGLNALEYTMDDTHLLTINRESEVFTASIKERQYDVLEQHAEGVINDSLFVSASEAGLPDNLIMQLASIFGYDIDFALDIRKGDSYRVIYEDRYLEGEKAKGGNILAAEFTSRGKTYRAVRYIDPKDNDGYFNPEGRNMKKAFLRTPVNFTRISSRFNLKRKHPILHKIRAHKGVDYAAPRGTPVKAAGNGKIIHRGTKGGYGKAIIIRHGSGKTTLYGHLNNYRKGQRVGSRVKQGEIIGYVGSTGRATGPHLHYEFRVNGVHRNPLTVKLPKADPLPAEYMHDFKQKSEPYLAWLSSLSSVAQIDN